MSSEKQTIYGFDLSIIHDYFLNVGRQGPGSPEMTLKALSFIDNLTDGSWIADIGCGTGGQTMVLAKNTTYKITGIDLCQDFITRLNQDAENNKLQDRVKGIVADMKNLPFQEEELDLIWSEGSIYNIGFERGLKEWRKFLKKGGYIAITENTWLTEDRPSEIEDFWQKAYPEIDVISNKVGQMQKAGYLPVATFVVPESCWTEYYSVMQGTHDSFLKKHKGNKTAEEFIAYQQYESGLFQKYKAYYGYAFYIGKRIE